MSAINLDEIVIDAGTQVRAEINEQVVAHYAERMTDGAQFPPIVVFHDGNRYYLADGFHRTMAARRNDWRTLEADVRLGTKVDALWFALGANRANGAQLTASDKKHAVLLALRQWPERSASQLAEQVGCNRRYVDQLKAEVGSTTNLPDRVTGKDGKRYPAKRTTEAAVSNPPADRSPYEARKAAAIEGASASSLRRLPKKDAAEIITNAIHALQGVSSAIKLIDTDEVIGHAMVAKWHIDIAEAIGVIRNFNRKLQQQRTA